ncbi:MAG: hypothetical protein H0U77_13090 [Nocardioidaceae bacterium]|nr:hypothetical protein [Nocardioidaceae bacterium]
MALAAGWWLLVPHDPTGGLRPGAGDPTAGIDDGDLDRIHLYGALVRPFEAATLVLSTAAVLLLGLTSAGARLTTRIAARVRLQSLRALLIAFAVVTIAWAVSLPAAAASRLSTTRPVGCRAAGRHGSRAACFSWGNGGL